MELRHLRYFVAVAEELSFTRAAERLHIGQPPLSHQIQMLEAEVGAQLLERSKRWVRLTEAGKLFLDDARRVLALSEQAMQTARRAERGEAGEIKVGFTFSTPLTPLFAAVINRYRQRYPGVQLTLKEMSTVGQIEALVARELDLGLVRPPELNLPDAVELTILRRDPLVMYPESAGTGIHPQINRLCREAGFKPTIAMEAGEASTIIGLVAAGCGVSVLPSSFDIIRMPEVCYRPLADAEATTALYLAKRKDAISPLVAAFVEVASAEAAAATAVIAA